jgi:2-polyprenyl-3-methyl-5-hydroxy-6-metoxy-1,4-benzoquinol methylase
MKKIKTSFQLENYRNNLAEQNKLKELKLTYKSKYPEIQDLNTASFWNKKLYVRRLLKMQDGMTQERVSIAASFLPIDKKQITILDIGMGDGWLEELLENKNITFTGNDISDNAIKNVKKRFNGNFSVKSLYDLNYNHLFDAIFLLEVLEHVPPGKTFKLLNDIKNLLKPNGTFILSVPTNEGLETMKENPNGHVRLYTVPLITAELEIAGFRAITTKTLYAFKNYYVVKKIMSRIFKNHWKPNNIIIKAQKK